MVETQRRARSRRGGLGLVIALGVGIGLGWGAADPAAADPHNPKRSGHPVRIIAYALHPVGVAIDTLLFRPAHWFVHRADWLETLFGHDPEED